MKTDENSSAAFVLEHEETLVPRNLIDPYLAAAFAASPKC